jgi:hypothetical protein
MQLAVGAGYGRGYSVLEYRTLCIIFCTPPYMYEVFSSPVLTFDLNVPVHKKFCFGPAFSYQMIRVGEKYSEDRRIDLGDTYHRLNFALRPMFMLPVNAQWSCYIGARMGGTYWHVTSRFKEPFHKAEKVPPSPSAQIFCGLRYRIGHFGLGVEAGIGTAPYLAQAHCFYQFRR